MKDHLRVKCLHGFFKMFFKCFFSISALQGLILNLHQGFFKKPVQPFCLLRKMSEHIRYFSLTSNDALSIQSFPSKIKKPRKLFDLPVISSAFVARFLKLFYHKASIDVKIFSTIFSTIFFPLYFFDQNIIAFPAFTHIALPIWSINSLLLDC